MAGAVCGIGPWRHHYNNAMSSSAAVDAMSTWLVPCMMNDFCPPSACCTQPPWFIVGLASALALHGDDLPDALGCGAAQKSREYCIAARSLVCPMTGIPEGAVCSGGPTGHHREVSQSHTNNHICLVTLCQSVSQSVSQSANQSVGIRSVSQLTAELPIASLNNGC